MMDRLPSLTSLVRQLQRVPYLASKNIYRVANYFLTLTPDQIDFFCTVLQEARARIVKCERCAVWREKSGTCPFCDAPDRDQTLICVVETWYDLMAIERAGGYRGVYHLLGGALSPLDGIGPENLSVPALVARLNDSTREIILACNQTPEGEATAAYVVRALEGQSVLITRLARGLPVGAALEFMDKLTLSKALSERRHF